MFRSITMTGGPIYAAKIANKHIYQENSPLKKRKTK